ncbi:MAG: DNA polymerase IV [Clostridia bacterium]|nr:DNA polymerase IV [Clostridia bacterium]
MGDVILHSDLNCFYASVEINENPSLRGKKVAVCGSTENRHGIVLTASYPAKREGVKTGMANWQALKACPDLIMVPPRYEQYLRYSHLVRSIYARYADDIEPFGMDECWLRLKGLDDPMGEGVRTAEEIRANVRRETGLTVSVGVSFSKIFAKLASDMKKPDAVTVVSRANYRDLAWPLKVEELLYVGPATSRRLRLMGVDTIGALARLNPNDVRARLGKNGHMLWSFANGLDDTPVCPADYVAPIKSVGHGTTCVRDLDTEYEVWRVLYELAQDVGHRLRKYGLKAGGVCVSVRQKDLQWAQYQHPLPAGTQSPLEIAQAGFALFRAMYRWPQPVRALSIRGIDMRPAAEPVQTDLFGATIRREKQRCLDDAVDDIRRRFGYESIRPASLMQEHLGATDRCETVQLPQPMYR